MDKLIIYVATGYPGSAHPKKPAIPKTWDEFYQGAKDCEEAGASIIHFHGPHDKNGRIVPDEWGKVCEGIRKHTNLLVDFGQAGAPIEQRRELMQMGSANPDFMGISLTNHDYRRHSDKRGYFDVYYEHQRPELEEYARLCIEQNIKPNWEVWHLGALWNFNFLKDQGLIKPPYWFCLLFGTPGGVWSPSSAAEVNHRLDHMPAESHSMIAPRGPAGPINQTRMLTLGIIRGAHVRLGCQDLSDYEDGVPAKSNAQIVSRIARIAKELGREIATPDDVRKMLGMAGAKKKRK